MKTFWRRDEIEDFALVTLLEFRRQTGLLLCPPIDVDLVGELACGLQWDWDVLPEPPQTRFWAALFPQQSRVTLNEKYSEIFAANSGLERFTKAHEIGHWMLHVNKQIEKRHQPAGAEYSASEYGSGHGTPEYAMKSALRPKAVRRGETDWFERHADWFAAALLMPAGVLVPLAEDLDLHRAAALRKLAGEFDVSQAAMKVRLSQLKLLPNT